MTQRQCPGTKAVLARCSTPGVSSPFVGQSLADRKTGRINPGAVVKKVEEYRTHAAECLSLSRRTDSEEEKVQLEKMAEVWETLAQYRESSKQRG